MTFRLALVAATIAVFCAAPSPYAAGDHRPGHGDGDTIEIGDAPESWQTCEDGDSGNYRGQEASIALDQFLAASRPTRCAFVERDG